MDDIDDKHAGNEAIMASFTPINEVVQSAAMGELKSKKNVEPEEVDHSDEGVITTDKNLVTPKKLKKEDPESKKDSNKKTSPNKRLIKEEGSPVEPKKRRTPAKTKTELNVTGNEMSPSAKKGKSPMKPKIDFSVPLEQEEAHVKPENAVTPTGKQEHKRDKLGYKTTKETKPVGSAKSKGTALAKATKNTSDTDEEGATTPTVVPVTPKGKKPNKKAKIPNGEDGSPVGHKRSVTKTAAAEARPIPTRLEHASPADQNLVAMRDAGESWNDIRKMWKDMTGLETAHSTLPGRYKRLKENLIRLEEGDAELLIAAKAIVEKKLETEKYTWIATEVEKLGGRNYPSSFIQKELKRLASTDSTYPATADTSSTTNTALANTANDADQEETDETD